MAGGLALVGVVACFALSGFAALIYQTAWLRELCLVFGSSELAVATVLAAYMGGLAAGAAVAGRLVHRVRRPVLVYGCLEAGIAVSALAVPALLQVAAALYAFALGDQPAPPDAGGFGQSAFYLIVAFVALAIPTGLMGATLPLLTKHAVRRDAQLGPRVALLYAANTGGAVVGALVAGFVLLPSLGLRGTVAVGAGVNLLIFGLAVALAMGAEETQTHAAPAASGPRRPAWILPIMLLSGANAFFYEVLWTRMLAHVLGGSLYAFASMLAAFLSGIAIGGGLAAVFARERERAALAFAASQVAIALLSMGVYAWMGGWIPETRSPQLLAVFAIAVMLPATLFVGATFPLAVRILARDEREASSGAARVYAWNTLGAIFGSVLAGFVWIPLLGFEGSVRLAVCVNLALGAFSFAVVARGKRVPAAVAAAGLLAALLLYHPARPLALVSSTGFRIAEVQQATELYYAVGRSSTVLLQSAGGYYQLRSNGLPEASVSPRGSPPVQDPEKWLTALPVVARPDAETMLVIGFGGGVALEAVPPSIVAVDVIELEPKVIEANRLLAGRREMDPLADPRVTLVINDARNALRLTRKRYDAIVSQPSHPWTAGASHLFTREFVRLAKQHLAPGGVFVQWMSSEFVTAPLLRSLAATLRAEFPHVRLYHPASTVLIFLSSNAPLDLELELARSGRPLAEHAEHFAHFGISVVEDLVTALAADESGLADFAQGAPPSTDDQNQMATHSRSRADGLRAADLAELFRPHDPLLRADGWIHAQLSQNLSYGYLTNRLAGLDRSWRAEALALVLDEPQRSLVRAVLHFNEGDAAAMLVASRSVIASDPENPQARYLILRDQLHRVGTPEATQETRAALEGLSGPVLAVVRGWQHFLREDWSALARLDPELARSRVTDLWHPEAIRLQAEWRTKGAGDRGRLAAEAIRRLDRTLLLWADRELYLLRARSAIAAGDRPALVESMHYIVKSIRRELDDAQGDALGAGALAQMRHSLEVAVAELAVPFRADSERGREVLFAARKLLAHVEELAKS